MASGQAATGPDDELAGLLEASADRAMVRGGPSAAVDQWQWAAEFSRFDADRARRFLSAAQVAVLAGQPERGRKLLALQGALLPDAPSQAPSRALLGAIEMAQGCPEAAYHLLVRAAKDLAAHDPPAALDSLVLAGAAATVLGDPGLTHEVSSLATSLRESGATVDESVVDLLLGLSKLIDGNWSDGSRILAGVINESAVSAEYGDVLRSGRAAMYLVALGRLGEARSLYVRAGVPGQGQLERRPARADAGSAGLRRTAARSATRRQVHALEGLRLVDDLSLDVGVGHMSMAMLYAYRGQQTECRNQVRLATELADSRQLKMVGAGGQAALGLLELGAGRLDQALAALESVASSTDGHPGILRWATPDLVEAAARSGRPEACAPAMEGLRAWADGSGLPAPVAALARCRGLLASGNEAVGYFEDALRVDEQDSRPLERARIQLLLGETLRRSRQRTQARIHLSSAMATFERLGAIP